MITGSFLNGVRRRALRRGVLYSSLDRVERGILVLSCRLLDRVRSVELGVEIVKILAKLREAMKSEFTRHVQSYGVEKARDMVELVKKLGNTVNWLSMEYAEYLALNNYNNPKGWSKV